MTSDAEGAAPAVTGRCYCGTTTIRAARAPETVAYCHCADCRRVTGAPVAAFAAFDEDGVTFTPDEGRRVTVNPGVSRSSCPHCGSPLAGRYDYLPGKIYIAIGLLDQANDLAPRLHSHAGERLSWLHIDDGLERFGTSARARLGDDGK
ncbi:GFA family protein [Marivibrio halodurans]|uniref:GFA family protein n=1 Tax=Marivibrio halodurans TaxID=2039722 RepID=A0A8J7RZS7_9PROT|nr:GFA family protein [Marivibrio halodurans]MBP5857717.1 GFA family protein [Marivibrio halodurans]